MTSERVIERIRFLVETYKFTPNTIMNDRITQYHSMRFMLDRLKWFIAIEVLFIIICIIGVYMGWDLGKFKYVPVGYMIVLVEPILFRLNGKFKKEWECIETYNKIKTELGLLLDTIIKFRPCVDKVLYSEVFKDGKVYIKIDDSGKSYVAPIGLYSVDSEGIITLKDEYCEAKLDWYEAELKRVHVQLRTYNEEEKQKIYNRG